MSEGKPLVNHRRSSSRASTHPSSSGPPAVRSSARVRRPIATIDSEGVRGERVRVLRKKRGGVLSSITAKRKEIDDLLNDSNNLEPVRVKLTEITNLFRSFVEAQKAYNQELQDEAARKQSNVFFSEIEASLNFFCDTVNDWLRVTEAKLQDMEITPDDSASQVFPQDRRKLKGSHGSVSSRASRTSSISTARVKEAAKIAEIEAEALALKRRQRLHEAELRLKREQFELQLKKEELKLETEYAKAVAREDAYAKAESKCPFPEELPGKPRPSSSLPDSLFKAVKDKQGNVSSKPKQIHDEKSVSSSPSQGSNESGLSDQAYQILAQQNRVMEEFVKQQQRNSLPRRQVPVFDGNPLQYCTFIRAFDTVIEPREPDYAGRLYYLEQHTSGRPQEIVRSCLYMAPKEGYTKARSLLERRFGQKHKIAMACLDQVINGPRIKAEDAESLEGLSILLSSCTNTLRSIGYSSKMENPDNMRKIIDRLPPSLQIKWRENADRILNVEGREIRIEDISDFVEQKSRSLSNPVFGKLPFLEKENTGPRERKSKARNDKPGAKRLSLATISERNVESQEPAVSLSSVNEPASADFTKCCLFCHGSHHLTDCSDFAKVSNQDRVDFVMKKRLCFACLRAGHQSRGCNKKKPCIHCGGRHATVMHIQRFSDRNTQSNLGFSNEIPVDKGQSQDSANPGSSEQENPHPFCGLTSLDGSVTALPIVPVKVRAKGNPGFIETYALLDNGSNSTFCSLSLLGKLGVSGKRSRLTLTTMGTSEEIDTLIVKDLEVSDLDENVVIPLHETLTRPAMPVAKHEIPTQEDVERWPHLRSYVNLSELDSQVELLIGANVPEALQPREVIPAVDGGPYATRVDLGWVINGPTGRKMKYVPSSCFFVKFTQAHPMCVACADLVDSSRCDDVGLSRDDLRFMNIVKDSVIQCEDSHYQIALPLKNPSLVMPENRVQAARRALLLKRRLSRDAGFREDYVTSLEDVIKDGFAEKVPDCDLRRSDGRLWYIPHHGVYHHKKPGKLRVVFDCSAQFRGASLNDELLQGPNLTNNLVGVLVRFRQDQIAVMGDIHSMFHQVRVPEADRDLLRFLWWPSGDFNQDLQEYRMTVHLFGAVSSPSCANFAVRKNAENHKHEFPSDVISTVLKNFYVDDCLKSLPSSSEAVRHVGNLRELMSRGGFNLTKWISNDRKVLESIPLHDRAKNVKELDLTKDVLPVERALGVSWSVENDKFFFKTNIKKQQCTRRGILSVVSSIYDQLGMAVPFILPAKVLLQDLCRRGLGWDDVIPSHYLFHWRIWIQGLPKLSKLSVDRCVKPPDFGEIITSQIHHFCDASQSAYGAVSYLRLVNSSGQIHCSFLIGKSRLAPLKQMTIPRLELAAATLSVGLNKMLKKELEMTIDNITFWTDSMTVIRYIQNESKRFHTFVANRVSFIREDSNPSQWKYINTKLNPADDASRGVSAESFIQEDRWIKGPAFLTRPESEWVIHPLCTEELSDADPEIKRESLSFALQVSNACTSFSFIVERFSSWYKLLKFIALCLRCQRRFVEKRNSRQQAHSFPKELLMLPDLERAEREIIKFNQRIAFAEEIDALQNGRSVKKSSVLVKLDPILAQGLLRVGGRLGRAALPEDSKHQIIIPRNSHLARLIVHHFHEKSAHSGREYVLSLLRERFWLIRANSVVRSVLSSCFACKRRHAPPGVQKMADLPIPRITPDKPPFTCVGIDYFGPFLIRQRRSQVKRYGAIFTCLALRAVHLEISHSLDTDSFILALRRFIARRGQVKEIRSDNGSNFVGGERELRTMIENWNQVKIHQCLLQRGIKWIFNPPSASHHGGAWERLIRSTRKVLNGLVKEQTLDDESLQTLMCEAESIINGRPLTKVSDDPRDLEPLTPNHLLLLRQDSPLPPGLFVESDSYSRRRWAQVQYLADIFWKRWRREYLPLLQQRQKWFNPKRNFAVGDTVIVVDDSSPRNVWPIGRITEVFPDNRGMVRRVKVQTKTSTLERPITKLCLLESFEHL